MNEQDASEQLVFHDNIDFDHPIAIESRKYGIKAKAKAGTDFIDFIKDTRIIRIALKHLVYRSDIIHSFEYYYSAVTPYVNFGFNIVDYSSPRWHEVKGFDLHPVLFPSLAEPVITTNQYLEFARLKPGLCVIDLGAYSGLTSIMFSELVADTGTVIAVDADPSNIECIKKNIDLYEKVKGNKIHLLEGAVWKDSAGLEFSSEGNMGASATEFVGSRGNVINVPSYTLTDIAAIYNLQNVDFIKCDIEGTEAVIFDDINFFSKFTPRIIIETHNWNGKQTTETCIKSLSKFGYRFEKIRQYGVALPLLECYPPE